jgi:phosphoglycolate phosphatase-like HAD superfamily hydrolase
LCESAGVAPAAALFVGDGDVDREAAMRAGVHFTWAADFFGRR